MFKIKTQESTMLGPAEGSTYRCADEHDLKELLEALANEVLFSYIISFEVMLDN